MLIAETFWDAFWIVYESCRRVCAGGLLFPQFSLKNYPLNVNTCVIIKQLKCCQSSLIFEMPKIFFPFFFPLDSDRLITGSVWTKHLLFFIFFLFNGPRMWKGCWQVFCLKLSCETPYPSDAHFVPLPQSYIDSTSPPSGGKHTFHIPGNKLYLIPQKNQTCTLLTCHFSSRSAGWESLCQRKDNTQDQSCAHCEPDCLVHRVKWFWHGHQNYKCVIL